MNDLSPLGNMLMAMGRDLAVAQRDSKPIQRIESEYQTRIAAHYAAPPSPSERSDEHERRRNEWLGYLKDDPSEGRIFLAEELCTSNGLADAILGFWNGRMTPAQLLDALDKVAWAYADNAAEVQRRNYAQERDRGAP